jgi:putative phage-type endonuclease
MHFFEKLKDLVSLIENWLPNPEDNVQIGEWEETAFNLSASYDFTETEHSYVERILEMYEEQFKIRLKYPPNAETQVSQSFLDNLLSRKQTEQRTAEWYAQQSTIISASELGSLFGAPRQRAKLVMSKTVPYTPRSQPLATLSDGMSAFDWGIRFEPVVKQVYELKYGTVVKELGRLHHPTDPRCTASPDGLVYSCPKNKRTGHLIEIKCPVSREVDGKIPKDYYNQMQMQLHVTECKVCDYIEAVFSSKYNNSPIKEGPALYSGLIALVRYKEITNGQEFYYIYGTPNDEQWQPVLGEDEELVEMIPWRLMDLHEQAVLRSEDWWQSTKPLIDVFWEDVEKAKRGEFVVPESTRLGKHPRDEKCIINFQKLDESGQPIG